VAVNFRQRCISATGRVPVNTFRQGRISPASFTVMLFRDVLVELRDKVAALKEAG
jgi:hypothetical protein